MTQRTTNGSALRLLAHPLWWGALAVLVLNDHALKGAGILDGALTGKLSDLAGLLVAPALLAALLGVRTRRGLAGAHAAVGAVFAAINVSALAASGFAALTALTPWPWAITVDPTDLVALPMLLVSWRVFAPALERKVSIHPLLHRGALVAGSMACMATSPPIEPDPPPLAFPTIWTDLAIGNASDEEVVVRVRALKESVYLDCDAVAADPTHTLSRELFDTAQGWLVEPNRAFGVRGDGNQGQLGAAACYAYLVDGGGLPPALLFWRDGEPALASVPSTLESPDAARTVLIERGEIGLTWAEHPSLYSAPPLTDPTPKPGCAAPDDGVGVSWSTPVPLGEQTLVSVTSSPDGCHRLDLLSGVRWYVCTAPGVMPFSGQDSLFIATLTHGQDQRPLEGLELIGAHATLRLGRGGDVVRFGAGDASFAQDAECGAQHDACGSLLLPLSVTVREEGANDSWRLFPGERVAIGGGDLHVLRAQRMPVGDAACLEGAAGSADVIHSVFAKEVQ